MIKRVLKLFPFHKLVIPEGPFSIGRVWKEWYGYHDVQFIDGTELKRELNYPLEGNRIKIAFPNGFLDNRQVYYYPHIIASIAFVKTAYRMVGVDETDNCKLMFGRIIPVMERSEK